MALVSFANLDQDFDITTTNQVEYSAANSTVAGASYSYITTGGDDWEFFGAGITSAGGFPTGGTVSALQVDLDDDDFSTPEIIITGLADIPIVDFDIGTGTATAQNNRFWEVALQGDDTFDFTLADFSVDLFFAGDGANIDDGAAHAGGDDSFIHGGAPLTGGSGIFGDYYNVNDGTLVGGDDVFTVGVSWITGDARQTGSDGVVLGGDDVITPEEVADNDFAGLFYSGDVWVIGNGVVAGGDDLIDLRATDLTGFTDTLIQLAGDGAFASGGAAILGGDDTIYGTARADEIAGEVLFPSAGAIIKGGDDQLFGMNGDDTIRGNSGADLLEGGNGEDSLDGGNQQDTLRGGNDNDELFGGGGNDNLDGGNGADTLRGQAGQDTLFGQNGNDRLFGGAGNDTLIGGANSDILRGEDDNDVLKGSGGNDQLFGGGGNDSLFGDEGTDKLNGDANADNLDGGGGNDTLAGNSGADTLFGRDGNDRLLGGGASDDLFGGANADTLIGGTGNDLLDGGGGNDTFVFAPGDDADVITGFTAGAGSIDAIDVSAMGAGFSTFAEIQAATTTVGGNAVIDFGGGDMITIIGVTEAQLHADDFIFGP